MCVYARRSHDEPRHINRPLNPLSSPPPLKTPKRNQYGQALAQLSRLFPADDPFALLQRDPLLLNNIGGEVDIEADPQYGELTTAG